MCVFTVPLFKTSLFCTAFCDDLLQQVHWISSPVNRRDEIAFNRHSSRLHIRDLTIRQQPRPWKRRWKIDFTSFHFFRDYSKGPSSCLKEGSLGWSWREGPAPEFRRKYTGTTKKCTKKRDARAELLGAIHSTKIPTGPTGKSGPPHKVDPFFRNFPVGPNRSIEFWTEISGNFWMDHGQHFYINALHLHGHPTNWALDKKELKNSLWW